MHIDIYRPSTRIISQDIHIYEVWWYRLHGESAANGDIRYFFYLNTYVPHNSVTARTQLARFICECFNPLHHGY